LTVPPLLSEETVAFAEEQLEKNKHDVLPSTAEPTLLPEILVCQLCAGPSLGANHQAESELLSSL